jgi:hypothetical protein
MDKEPWETNRIKARRSKLGWNYCYCERAIGDVGKCVCGRRHRPKKLKKF